MEIQVRNLCKPDWVIVVDGKEYTADTNIGGYSGVYLVNNVLLATGIHPTVQVLPDCGTLFNSNVAFSDYTDEVFEMTFRSNIYPDEYRRGSEKFLKEVNRRIEAIKQKVKIPEAMRPVSTITTSKEIPMYSFINADASLAKEANTLLYLLTNMKCNGKCGSCIFNNFGPDRGKSYPSMGCTKSNLRELLTKYVKNYREL